MSKPPVEVERMNGPDLPDPARRAFSMALGLFPMLPLLPGCSAGFDENAGSAQGQAQGAQAGVSGSSSAGAPTPTTGPAPVPAPGPSPAPAPAPTPGAPPAPAPAPMPASASGVFRHPGLLVTEDDFTRLRALIAKGEEPWTTWWNKLCADSLTSLDGKPNPQQGVYRQDRSKYAMWRDIQRAWCLALRWKLSDDIRYADKAVETLDAWANTLKVIGTVPPGSTAPDDHTFILLAGMQGHQWAQAGEIMRGYAGWAPENLKRFQDMLLNIFAPVSSWFLSDGRIGSHANWDMASLAGALAMGVFCDKPDLYRLACDCYAGNNRGKLRTFGNGSIVHGVYYMHPGHFGQWEESGRDQGHSTLGMSLGGDLLEMAWNQGDDLYGLYNNRFLSAAEYVARSNLQDENGKPYSMPYTPEQNPTAPHTNLWTEVSQPLSGPGSGRNCWEPIYNHYVNRLGLAAPNVARMVVQCEPNQWSTGGDDVVFPTLVHRRAAYAGPMKPPSGVTAFVRDGRPVLSWWGSVGAASYVVKRGAGPTGPFIQLATVKADELLTHTDTPPDGIWFYQVTALASGGASASSSAVRAVVPGESRLSMPLNGVNGTGAVGALVNSDGSRTGIEGTLIEGATWGDGRSGDKAIVFDGKSAGLQLPAGVFSGLDDFTISMWAYANSLHWDSCMFFAGQDAFSAMCIAPQSGRGGLRFTIFGATGNDAQAVEASSALPTRRWVHVAVTLRGSTGRLYLDGVEVGRSDDFRLSPRQVGDQVTFLGRNWGHPAFNGRIQGLRVEAGALSAAEIAALAK
jgi:hypothetical protein